MSGKIRNMDLDCQHKNTVYMKVKDCFLLLL
jgi:hypothetical protein